MMKDNSQCPQKLREPSTPNITGDPPQFPRLTAWGTARPVGIDPPVLVGRIVRWHTQRFQAWNFGRRATPRRRKHLLGDPCRAPSRTPSSVGSILSLSNDHRPAPPPSSAGLFPLMKLPDSTRNARRRERQNTFFRIILVLTGILLFSGCHGFKFTSGMFNFEASGHSNHSSIPNDSNATHGIE